MATTATTVRGNAPLRLHQRCELNLYGRGEILFVGQTSFQTGLWVGISLDEPVGKHDGVVQGKRYFTATPDHGIFVRASQVRVIAEEEITEEDTCAMEEEAATPIDSPVLPASRTSAASSRTPSRSATSPIKATRPGMLGVIPPPASSAAAGSAMAGKSRISSPVKGTVRATSARSPLKTPARGGTASTPMSRAGTHAGGIHTTSRPPSNLGRPSTTSPSSRAVKTPGVRSPPITAASRNVARLAVQGANAPDTTTARAGLRPVVKSRPSMAPSATSHAATLSSNPRTPSSSASSAARRPGAAPTSGPSRSSANVAATRPMPPQRAATTTTSTPLNLQAAEYKDEEEEDLMAMDITEGEVAQTLQSSNDSDELARLAEQQEEGLSSPSLRKGAAMARHQEYMSLSSGPSMSSLNRNTAEVAAMQRELEELRVKVKIAEKRRDEDREKIKEAERMQMESEQFLAMKPKLTAKQQELQDELKDLRKLEKDWAKQKEDLERQLNEINDQLEMTALDREVAEEKAEGALEELRIMTDKVEELQVDIEVLREENALYEQGPVDDKDKLSIGYMQLEKQNERLKDALLRLRDMSAETDAEQRKRVSQLEKDLSALDNLQASYDAACTKLETSDALLEDLKIQLDDALGAEEMLEQLTERNMALTDRLNEMTIVVEDLESLKEINDELEETHLETEKQLQEEVDLKDMQLREHQMRTESLEANIVEYENTFAQFRELVLNLQSEVEALRNNDQTRDAGKGGDEQAMLNLNLKLQTSTLKSQAKTIELEMGKLQARQAKDNLKMISPYLPREFFDNDKDACDSLLFFQRMAAKTDIIKTIVEGNHDIATNLVGVVEESLIKVCKMRHSLAHFIVFCRQISAMIQLASIPTFLKAGRMYKELSTMERRIDYFVDQLREEALNEEECGKEYNRFVTLLEDFDFALADQGNEGLYSDLAAKELGSAILFDLDLDTIAAALGFSKQNVAALYNELANQQSSEGNESTETVLRISETEISEGLFKPIQDLINNIRATKVPARKLLRRLSSLYDNSEAVKMEAIAKLPGLGRMSSQLVELSTMLVSNFSSYTGEIRVNKTPFEIKVLLKYVQDATIEVLGQSGGDSVWMSTSSETAKLSQTVAELLGAATEQENVMKITGIYPWLERVDEIRKQQSENVESQRIIVKQTEDLKDLYKQTKIRDELLQENTIKIERLTKQLRKSKDELNAVDVLRSDLSEMTKRMKAYEEGNSALQGELEQLQREYERVLKEGGAGTEAAAKTEGDGTNGPDGATSTTAPAYSRNSTMTLSSYETSYLVGQLEAVRGALRHLRMENSMLKSRDALGQLKMLPPLKPAVDASLDEDEVDLKKGLPKARKETKMDNDVSLEGRKLVKELMQMASSPRVISLVPPATLTGQEKTRRTWTPLAKLPQMQYLEQTRERNHLQRQIQHLHAKIGASNIVSLRA